MSRELFYVIASGLLFVICLAVVVYSAPKLHTSDVHQGATLAGVTVGFFALCFLVMSLGYYGTTLPSAAIPEPTKEVGK